MTTQQEPNYEIPEIEEVAKHFPGYEIIDFLGFGGVGAVYRAHSKHLDREVALKLLLNNDLCDVEFNKQFLAEAESMSLLVHGSELYDAITTDGVQPLLTAKILMRICEGMAHAHDHGVLHRDLKPENILITESLNPKIADFGLARDMIENPSLVDAKTDIYALGCIMYQMITGKAPDPENMDYAKFDYVDPSFKLVLYYSLNPDRNYRYHSALDMSRALRDIILNLEEKGSDGTIVPETLPEHSVEPSIDNSADKPPLKKWVPRNVPIIQSSENKGFGRFG